MMKINHMICPKCGHDFYVDTAYATCDACGSFFYATESATSRVLGGIAIITEFKIWPAEKTSQHPQFSGSGDWWS
jgi:hypothetical protein